ncbi:uncharacterized protein AAEQ78_001479 [Lycaon pictus]
MCCNHGNSCGYGCGCGYGYGCGPYSGCGYRTGYGCGYGSGYGCGCGYGSGWGCGRGFSSGCGYGSGCWGYRPLCYRRCYSSFARPSLSKPFTVRKKTQWNNEGKNSHAKDILERKQCKSIKEPFLRVDEISDRHSTVTESGPMRSGPAPPPATMTVPPCKGMARAAEPPFLATMCCNYSRNSCDSCGCGCGYGSGCGCGYSSSSGCGYGCGYGSACCGCRPFSYRRCYSIHLSARA